MREPGVPSNENERMAALESLCILDTSEEQRFDRLTRLARQIFDVPVALVSLVDRERQWFKSAQGVSVKETPRVISFCGHAILDSKVFVVEDARKDPRFSDNPLVTGEPGIRFYAGQPLSTWSGHTVGTLCIVDYKPRSLSTTQLDALNDLSAIVENELNQVTLNRRQRSVDAAETRLYKFFTLSLDMLCIADFDGYFQHLNPAWSTTLGYSMDELLGHPFLEFVHPDDYERTVDETRKLQAGQATVSFENRYRCKDGTYKHILWSSTPDLELKLYFAVARDITKIRVAEQEVRRAGRMAEEASHAKSQFLANMSHEFRTPLNSVIGFANVLLEEQDHPLSEKQRDVTERIRASGLHLLELVRDILDVAKIEAKKVDVVLESVALPDLVTGVIEQLEIQARARGLELRAELPEDLRPLRTDPQKMKRILINLVGNAVKFTRTGSVTVRILEDKESRQARRIEVVDTGVGIPAEQLDSIFDDFRQVDGSASREYGGTGLGLTICKSLCSLLGYEIRVTSELGAGSTFSVDLGTPD